MTPNPIPLRADPGARYERAITALSRSLITIANNRMNPGTVTRSFIRGRWGEDAGREVETVLKAASAPAMTSVAGWAAELAQTTNAFLALLTPLSAGADLLQRGLQLDFAGVAHINLPTVAVPLADFVAQGAPIPVLQGSSSMQAVLEPHKFACIVVLTREMVENSGGEVLIRDALLANVGPSLDRRLFDTNAAVPDLRPAGLLNGKTALTASTNTDKLGAMIADISALAEAVAPYAGNLNLAFVAAARQAAAIRVGTPHGLTFPLAGSTSLAQGTVICIAVNALVTATGSLPEIDETRVAELQMDSAPVPIGSVGPITAMFQTDKIGLRLRWPITWALRNPNAIAYVSSVSWP